MSSFRSASSECQKREGSFSRAFALPVFCYPTQKSSGYSNPDLDAHVEEFPFVFLPYGALRR